MPCEAAERSSACLALLQAELVARKLRQGRGDRRLALGTPEPPGPKPNRLASCDIAEPPST
jgi:hypothetical protein